MSNPPRAVLDTNVLISGLLKSPNCRRILDQLSHQAFCLISSDALHAELLDVLGRPKCRLFVDDEACVRLLRLLKSQALTIEPSVSVTDSPDPKDAFILSLVREAKPDVLVTGDRQLLALRSYGGVKILSPKEFLTWLSER